jgi:hypothetical protein
MNNMKASMLGRYERRIEMIRHKGKLFLALLVVLFPATLGAASAGTKGNLDGFDAFMAKAMEDFKVPGAAVAVVKDGKVLFEKGYGYRDTARKLPPLFPGCAKELRLRAALPEESQD